MTNVVFDGHSKLEMVHTNEEKDRFQERIECSNCFELLQKPVYKFCYGDVVCKSCYANLEKGCLGCDIKLEQQHPIRELLMLMSDGRESAGKYLRPSQNNRFH